MNRQRYKPDAGTADIVQGLRGAGCSVALIQGANGQAGVPDLLCGLHGRNLLIEVKRPKAKGQPAGRLSEDQLKWMASWRGQTAVVTTLAEALAVVGLL